MRVERMDGNFLAPSETPLRDMHPELGEDRGLPYYIPGEEGVLFQ